MKSLAYSSLVCLILKYGAVCWDLFREGQINVLDQVQKKAAKFGNLYQQIQMGNVGAA